MDQPGSGAFTSSVRIRRPAQRDSALNDVAKLGERRRSTFDTPFQIFGRDFKNSFRITQQRNNFPQQFTDLRRRDRRRHRDARIRGDVQHGRSTGRRTSRCRRSAHNRFNLTPSVSLQNVDPGPFWVASERTNGQFVHQGKRFTLGLSASPTLFGLFRGVGPFERIRHSITPIDRLQVGAEGRRERRVSASRSAARGTATSAICGRTTLTFGLTQNFEAKIRQKNDSNPDAAKKHRSAHAST